MCCILYFLNKSLLLVLFYSFRNNNLNNLEQLNFYNNINLNSNFASYLTGLIEGDGSIIVPKMERSLKEKLNYPSI